MAVNLALLTTAAPYILDAANRIIASINKNKKEKGLQDQLIGHDEKLDLIEKRQNQLLTINEEQSKVIKDLAEQHQTLIIALRNTRIIAVAGGVVAVVALVLALLLK